MEGVQVPLNAIPGQNQFKYPLTGRHHQHMLLLIFVWPLAADVFHFESALLKGKSQRYRFSLVTGRQSTSILWRDRFFQVIQQRCKAA